MKNFKTIAVLVHATQWLGTSEQKESLLAEGVIMESAARDGSVLVPTLEGNLTCRLNDYIVTDESGQRSVVDAETFEAGYELSEDVEASTEVVTGDDFADEDVAKAIEVVEDAAEDVVSAPDVSEAKKGSKKL